MNKRLIGGIATALLPLCNAGIAGSGSYGYAGARGQKHQPLVANHTAWLPNDKSLERSYLESANLNIKSEQIELARGQTAKELVIIDGTIPDKHVIYKNSGPYVDVVEIKPGQSGVSQLRGILSQYHELDAMHVFTHANDGVIKLGNSNVTQESLTTEISTLASIDNAMKDGADLYFYGCDLAKTEQGEELLELISNTANVDVAASNNKTGHSDLGGDWDLEIVKGDIDKQVPVRYDSITMTEFNMTLPITFGYTYGYYVSPQYTNISSGTISLNGSAATYQLQFSNDDGSSNMYSDPGAGYLFLYNNTSSTNYKVYIDVTDPKLVFDLTQLQMNKRPVPTPATTFRFTSDKGGVVTQSIDGSGVGKLVNFSGPQWQQIKRVTIERDDGAALNDTVNVPAARVGIFNMQFANMQLETNPGGVVNGLELWLKADAGLDEVDTAPVDTWVDQSVTGNSASEVTNQPDFRNNFADSINFNPIVVFNGTDDRLIGGALDLSSDSSFISVVKPVDASVSRSYINTRPSAGIQGAFLGHNANNLFLFSDSGNVVAPNFVGATNLVNNQPILHSLTSSSAAHSMGLNGAVDATVSVNGSNMQNRVYRLAHDIPNGSFFEGGIAEIINYSDDISPADLQKIESYLAVKYGLSLDPAVGAYRDSVSNIVWGSVCGEPVTTINPAVHTYTQTLTTNGGDHTFSYWADSISNNGGAVFTITNSSGAIVFGGNDISEVSKRLFVDELEKSEIILALPADTYTVTAQSGGGTTSTGQDFCIAPTQYWNDVFGIGRDDDSGLLQKVSTSINPGTVMTVALDNDFFSPNNNGSRTNTFANDLEFIMFGNNGGGINLQTNELDAAPYTHRTVREWQIQSSTTTNTVSVRFNGFAGFALIQSADANFSTMGDQSVVAILDSNGAAAGVNLTDGAHLTLAADLISPNTHACSTAPNPASNGTMVTTTCTIVEPGSTLTIPNMVCMPTPTPASGIVDCVGTVGPGTTDVSVENDIVTVTDPSGNSNTGTNTGLIIDNTMPTNPSCSSTPTPANNGTPVTTTCTSVEPGTTLTIPNMVCNPTPTDATGTVVCTSTIGTGSGLVNIAFDTVTITDPAGNSNTNVNTGLDILNNPLITGTDGIGAGNIGLYGLLLLLLTTISRRLGNIRRKALIAAIVSLVLVSPLMAEQCDWYIGAGVGQTAFDPDRNGSGISITDDTDSGYQLLVGYDFTDNLSLEAYYADFGSAATDVPGDLDYSENFGLGVLYHLFNAQDSGFSAYIGAGVSSLNVESNNVPFIQENDAQIYGSVGAEYGFKNGFGFRLEYKDVSGDANLFSINFTKRVSFN